MQGGGLGHRLLIIVMYIGVSEEELPVCGGILFNPHWLGFLYPSPHWGKEALEREKPDGVICSISFQLQRDESAFSF